MRRRLGLRPDPRRRFLPIPDARREHCEEVVERRQNADPRSIDKSMSMYMQWVSSIINMILRNPI